MPLPKSKIFLLFCLCFVSGVFFGRYLSYEVMAILAIFFVALASIFWKKKSAMLIGFLGLIMLLGAWRYKTSFASDKPNFVGQLYGQEVEMEGVVVKEPDIREKSVNLTLESVFYEGKVLLNVGRYPEYEYGDRVKLSGKIEEPFESEEFSYKDYLSRFDTYAVMRYPKVEKLAVNQGNPVKAALLKVKGSFREVLSEILPEPHNALVLGLILGLKRALSEDLQNALIATGVSHIVVISGYNISILTRNILKTRWVWGKRVAFTLSLLVVAAFVVLTGAEASVIRAAIMGLLLVFALNIGRLYQPVNALILTASVMVALNPKILVFDVGFQLSFLATLGLIYLAPIFDKWLKRLPDILAFRTNLSSTLAAQIFTLPILIFNFERISLIALPVNVLVLWIIPYAMFFGFLTGLLGFIYLPLGQIAGGLAWVFLEYLIRVVEFFARLPLASVHSAISWAAVAIYYIILILAIWIYRKRFRFNHLLEYVEAKV